MGSSECFQYCRVENNKLQGALISCSLSHRCSASHMKSKCKKHMYMSNLSEESIKCGARADNPFAIFTQQRQPEKSA